MEPGELTHLTGKISKADIISSIPTFPEQKTSNLMENRGDFVWNLYTHHKNPFPRPLYLT